MLKRSKLHFFILEHILHLLDTYSKNSDCKIFNCIEYLPEYLVRFLSFCFVKVKRNIFFFFCTVGMLRRKGLVGVALSLLIRKYIQCSKLSMIMADVLSGRTSISSPNKIRPFKQRFLRKTSNPAFSTSDNSFKYSSYAIELVCIYICAETTRTTYKRH